MNLLLVTGPDAASVDALADLFLSLPDVHVVTGRDLLGAVGLLDELVRQGIRHPDTPWLARGDGDFRPLATRFFLAARAAERPAALYVDADEAYARRVGALAATFPGARIALVLEDGRRRVPADASAGAIATVARAWAKELAEVLEGVGDADVDVVDLGALAEDPRPTVARLLTACGVPPRGDVPPRDALRVPPLSPEADAVFRAVPEADALLVALGWAEPREDGPVEVPPAEPAPAVPPHLARVHPDEAVRAALARDLVARGLDEEAAEALTACRLVAWRRDG